jgi:hypothetical protein
MLATAVGRGVAAIVNVTAGLWTDLFNSDSSPATAEIRIDNDGDLYYSDATGAYGAAEGTWLTQGSTSNVWVERTIVSGTLDTDTIGAGRVSMTTNRFMGVVRSTVGTKTATVSVEFFDAAAGGNSLGATANFDISADVF